VAGRRIKRALAMVALLVCMGGCAANHAQENAERAVSDYFAGNYVRAQDRLRDPAKKPDENFVLNNVRLGSAALVDYDLDTAEDAFLRAYEVINSVGVNDGGRSLGAALVSENLKVWKGEPYERAMANFYLGLIYYMRRDYGNARGAFENALFKLRDYADKQDVKDNYSEQESNFTIALMMLGKAYQRLGRNDLAQANFDRARELRPDMAAMVDPERNATSNLLLVVEYGYGPRKVTDGDGAIVGFSPTPDDAGLIPPPQVVIDGRPMDLSGLDRAPIDLLAMAQDRRWQDIDTIRAVKSGLGTGLIAGGAITTIYGADRRDAGTALAGIALMGAGALLKLSSHADVRQWEMLPRTVFILPLRVPPGRHDVSVFFPQSAGMRQTWRDVVVPTDGEATYYMRMQRWTSGEHVWPPAALAGELWSLE
jgi:tetratricopeptide (TPR) repeat protein